MFALAQSEVAHRDFGPESLIFGPRQHVSERFYPKMCVELASPPYHTTQPAEGPPILGRQ